MFWAVSPVTGMNTTRLSPSFRQEVKAEMHQRPAKLRLKKAFSWLTVKSHTPRKQRQSGWHWLWFGFFLALAIGFFYLSFLSFVLVNTAEAAVSVFKVTRWGFLGVGAGLFGLSMWHLVRALRKEKERRNIVQ